ncbi:ATP-binding protein [Catenuloplanes indicus]|uniref:DNA-binding CsgD family transcriptional regulator n=1 Tax=Catenuloplanes indicus TaxID=137267 RepID=A0AAE3VW07_9ACTN|nr:LuxR family transcriptional regulator [Catenuloplanes indicus]MDQ0365048.1 DNA-binding CsgD family transcriptional regulator [Catenuloplanes indicus]
MVTRRPPEPALLGRDADLVVIDAALTGAVSRGVVVIVRGEPGIGKTALLSAARQRALARNMRVLACAGVPIESDLPYSGLHQLLRPVIRRDPMLASATALSPAQRDTLLNALGLGDSEPISRHEVGEAVLALLAGEAAVAPVLVTVDDTHWLDRSTAQVVASVAHRLPGHRVVVIAAQRDTEPAGPLGDVPASRELMLGGLDGDTASRLLAAHAPDLPPRWRQRTLEVARGNPLALVELPAVLRHHDDSYGEDLPLTDRLERTFGMRARELSHDTRMLLLAAALHDRDDQNEIVSAAGRAAGRAIRPGDLAEAVDTGLLEVGDGTLRFRHPLMRSAVRRAATAAHRHGVHAALAEILAADPDRRVWHRAAACLAPDESVAAELERAASRAMRRGAPDAASVAMERAARLSPDTAERVRRLVTAADIGFGAGGGPRFARLIAELEILAIDPVDRARLAYWQEELLRRDWPGDAGVVAAIELTRRQLAAGHAEQALSTLASAAVRAWWVGPTGTVLHRLADTVRHPDLRADELTRAALLALIAPEQHSAPFLHRYAAARDEPREPADDVRLSQAAGAAGDMPAVIRSLDRAIPALRARGHLGLLAQALSSYAWAHLHLGQLELSEASAVECRRLSEEVGQPRWAVMASLAAGIVAGRRGDRHAAESAAAAAETVLLRSRAHPLLAKVELARGTAALGAGEFALAFDRLWRIVDPASPSHHRQVRAWALPELIEAGVRSGRLARLRPLHAELAALAERTGSPLLRAAVTATAPLLADDPAAAFDAAIAADLAAWPWHRARLLLAHGEWLRRERQAADARGPLREAHRIFRALGTVPWADRAEAEIRASGEHVRVRALAGSDALTPQELQIARLAASGLTNREIGDRLLLSHRTVGTHLYRIFPKLGVTARAGLARALEAYDRT